MIGKLMNMKQITAIGSSIMEGWSRLGELLPEFKVQNKAVGGTQTVDWVDKAGPVIGSTAPDAVLVYIGSNDIFERSEQEIVGNVRKIYSSCCEEHPGRLFIYLSIINAPQKAPARKKVDSINRTIRSFEGVLTGFIFLDINPAFLGPDGGPVMSYYQDDALHYTESGYKALAEYAIPLIRKAMSKLLMDTPRS